MSMINAEMVRAARAQKYRYDEGFMDGAPVWKCSLPADVSERLRQDATELAGASGVTFEIAENTLINHALKEHLKNLLWDMVARGGLRHK
jgi:thiamine monophosphate kinase